MNGNAGSVGRGGVPFVRGGLSSSKRGGTSSRLGGVPPPTGGDARLSVRGGAPPLVPGDSALSAGGDRPPSVVGGVLPSLGGGLSPPVGGLVSHGAGAGAPTPFAGDASLAVGRGVHPDADHVTPGGFVEVDLESETTIFGDRFEDFADDGCNSTGAHVDGCYENTTEGGAGCEDPGVAASSTLRRSQRQAALRNSKETGNEQSEAQGESYVAKGRKALFPMFISLNSLKRTVAQAISPEGKSQTEPSSKKTH